MNPSARKRILWLFVVVNLLNYMDRYVLAAVLQPIGTSLGLGDAQLGRLAMAFLVAYLLTAPLFGYLAERMSRMVLVSIGIALWSLATAGAAFANDFTTLMATRALVGVGEAAYASLGPAILSDVYPQKDRARIFTWFYLAIPVGSALGYALGGIVEGLAGWRASFLVAGLPGLLLAFVMWRLPDPPLGALDEAPDTVRHMSYLEKLKHLLTNRIWLACTVSYVGYTFAMGALSHWAPTLFQRAHGQSATTAGTIFGGIAVVTGIVGTLLGGNLTDRFQSRIPNMGLWVSIVTILASVPVVYLGLVETNPTLAYVYWSVGLFLLFVNTSPVNALTVSCLPASLRATGMAVNILLIHLFGDAISPELVGVQSEKLGSTGTALSQGLMISLPAIVLAGCALFAALKRRTTTINPN